MFYIVLLFIRAPFYVLLVFVVCDLFCLLVVLYLSCQYLICLKDSSEEAKPWRGDHLHKARAEESL